MNVDQVAQLIGQPDLSSKPGVNFNLKRQIYNVRGSTLWRNRTHPWGFPGPVYVYVLPAENGQKLGAWMDRNYVKPAEFLRAVGQERARWLNDQRKGLPFDQAARKRINDLTIHFPNATPKLTVTSEGLFMGVVPFSPPWTIVVISKPPSSIARIVSVSAYDGSPVITNPTLNIAIYEDDFY